MWAIATVRPSKWCCSPAPVISWCAWLHPVSSKVFRKRSLDDLTQECFEMVWPVSSTDRLHDGSQKGRSGRGVRAFGFGKIDADQNRERTRAVPEGRDHDQRAFDRRQENQSVEAALEGRHGVPALRTVPAFDYRAEPDACSDQGART